MEPARIDHVAPAAVTFEDGLGQRSRQSDPAGGPGIEILTLRPSFATVPSFEFALRERAARLASFRHASFVRVRSVDRTTGVEPLLRVVSDAVQGIRLSDLLAGAHERQVPIDINAALCLVRQLVPAVAMLHERAREVAHGALSLERLVVTPQARLLISEYILGAALEQLRYPRERYWSELRVALPAGPTAARLDHRTDVLQIGVTALSLVLGRQLRPEEFPDRLSDVVASTWAVSPRGGFEPLPPGLRGWLSRALQIDPGRSFQSAVEARAELDAILGDSDLIASPASLDAFLARFSASAPVLVEPTPALRQDVSTPSVAKSPATPGKPADFGADLANTTDAALTNAPDPIARADRNRTEASVGLVPVAPSTTEPAEPGVVLPVPGTPSIDDEFSTHDEFTAGNIEVDEDLLVQPDRRKWPFDWRWAGAAAAVVVVVAAGGSMAARKSGNDGPAPHASGTLELATNPPGAEVLVDGVVSGTTPLSIALEPGAHDVQVRAGGDSRSIPITINAGMKVSQYVELARKAAPRARPARKPAAAPAHPAAGPSPEDTAR